MSRWCAVVLAAAMSVSVLVGVTAMAPAPAMATAPVLDSVCDSMHTLGGLTNAGRKRAQSIMDGRVDLGKYGTLRLRKNPSWKPQAGLDIAGDRYQNSLHWALPLLKRGLVDGGRAGAAMRKRFRYLLHDWARDHPKRKRGYWVNHPQYQGFRLGTWVCSYRLLKRKKTRRWVAKQMRYDLKVALRRYNRYGNNTMLNQQFAAYAAAKEVGTGKQRRTARKHVLALERQLVRHDGSDREGAPGYGLYLATIMYRTAHVFDAYHAKKAARKTRHKIAKQSSFLAQASRPDRRLVTIGDTRLQRIPDIFANSSAAAWVRTSGDRGHRPRKKYTRWSGGYAFGRSAWVGGRDTSSTFYSVRTNHAPTLGAHRHSDTTGVTMYADGVAWVADPGPYAYDGSSLRDALVRRKAHSALVAPGSPVSSVRGERRKARRSGALDTTCVYDASYLSTSGVQLDRCVYYARKVDALVVQDFVRATTKRRVVRQKWVLPRAVDADDHGRTVKLSATAAGAARNARLVSTGNPRVRRGGISAGVLGQHYGRRETGSVVSVPIKAPRGRTRSKVTAIASQGGAVRVRTLTRHGKPAIRVTVGGRSQTFRSAFTKFRRLAAKASLTVSDRHVRRGKKVRFRTRVTAVGLAARHAKVRLQRWRHGHWSNLRTLRAHRHGRVSTRLRQRHVGTTYYRVHVTAKHGEHGWKAANSRTVPVTVRSRHRHRR